MKLARWSIRRPVAALAAMLILTLAAAMGLPRLELRMDGHALVPPEDPVVLFDAELRERFGIRDLLIVLLETSHPDGIYNHETLRRLMEISDDLIADEEIGPRHVMSLATERRDRVYPGTLRFRPFLDPFPDSPRLMELLREDVAVSRPFEGTLVSADATAAAILLGMPSENRMAVYERVVAAVEPHRTDGHRISVVGAPAAEALLGYHVLEDLSTLVPSAIALMGLVLGLGLRRLWGVVLGLAEVGACLAFTFGLMGWLDVPVYLSTSILPVVLVTLGLADEIHVFVHHQRRLALAGGEEPVEEVVAATLADMARPVLLTSATTGVGFLSFVTSGIEPIRMFGVFAAVGILFCLVFTLSSIPAALVLLGAGRLHRPAAGRTSRTLFPPLHRSRATLAVLALVTLALGAGVPRLYVQDSWIGGFSASSPFRRDTEHANRKLHGTHVLVVHLGIEGRAGEPPRGDGMEGWFLDPELLERVGELERHIGGLPGVGGVLGPHLQLSTVAHLWLGRKVGTDRIPDTPKQVSRLVRFFDVIRGKQRRRELLTDELDGALLTIFLKDANYLETRSLIMALRDWERERLEPLSIRIDLAGDVAVSQAMIPAIVRSQVTSILAALAGAWITLSLLFRSPRLGLAALAPAGVSVLWSFGLMGWTGIPLGVATSIFCAVSLGVGVDYSIHFLEAHRRAAASGEPEPARRAAEESGPAIVLDMLAVALGFGLLGVSQVPANAHLGLLVAVALAAACLLTLAGLGAWMAGRRGSS